MIFMKSRITYVMYVTIEFSIEDKQLVETQMAMQLVIQVVLFHYVKIASLDFSLKRQTATSGPQTTPKMSSH